MSHLPPFAGWMRMLDETLTKKHVDPWEVAIRGTYDECLAWLIEWDLWEREGGGVETVILPKGEEPDEKQAERQKGKKK